MKLFRYIKRKLCKHKWSKVELTKVEKVRLEIWMCEKCGKICKFVTEARCPKNKCTCIYPNEI